MEGEGSPSHVQVGTSHSQAGLLVEFNGVMRPWDGLNQEMSRERQGHYRPWDPGSVRSSAGDERGGTRGDST
jgi:hypothetical protein